MRVFIRSPRGQILLRLCVFAMLAAQMVMPGVAMAAASGSPVVTAILCTDQGPVEVEIDLATGAPVETAQHPHCPDCTACGTLALVPGSSGQLWRAEAPSRTRIGTSGDPRHPGRALTQNSARGPPMRL